MEYSTEKSDGCKAEKKPAKTRNWLKYAFIVSVALTIVSGLAIYLFFRGPASGAVKPLAQNKEEKSELAEVPEAFPGKYVSFLYNSSYVLKTHKADQDENGVILEQAFLSETSTASKKIGLTVRNLPSHRLEDDPDYKMREINPERYRKEAFAQSNPDDRVFISTYGNPFEKTFFVQHNDLLAIISVTAPAPADETLDNEADLIAESLTWNK